MEQAGKERNLRVLAASQFMSGLANGLTQAVWQPFVLSLGAPMATLGLLESIGGVPGIVNSLIQPVGGWLSDRRGRKPFVVLGSLAGLLAIGLYVVAALTRDWRWLLAGIVLLGLSLIGRPAADSLVAESSMASRRAIAFSVLTFAFVVPGVFAPALGGYIADRWDFMPVLAIRLGLEALRLALLVWLLRETLGPAKGAVSRRELGGLMASIFWPPRQLRGFFWAMALDVFAWGMGGIILFGLLSKDRGFTTVQLGLMASMFYAVWAATQMPLGRLMDRFGCKRFLAISQAMGILLMVGWLFASSFWAFVALQAVFGLTSSLWVPAQQAIFTRSVPAEQRGEAIGRLAAFRGLISFPAPFIGGLLYDNFGFSAPILANLVGCVIALLAIIVLVKEPRALEPSPSTRGSRSEALAARPKS